MVTPDGLLRRALSRPKEKRVTGSTYANLTPHLVLTFRDGEGVEREVEMVIDTGFDGELVLPSEIIAELDAPRSHTGESILADGRRILADLHEVDVFWDGRWTTAYASSLSDALIGTRRLRGYRLSVDVVPGGAVTLQPLAR